MAIRSTGILGGKSNPIQDSDVIVTAAVLGHAKHLLDNGLECCFEVEHVDPEKEEDPVSHEEIDLIAETWNDLAKLQEVVDRINCVLFSSVSVPGKETGFVSIGLTPIYHIAEQREIVDLHAGLTLLLQPGNDLCVANSYFVA